MSVLAGKTSPFFIALMALSYRDVVLNPNVLTPAGCVSIVFTPLDSIMNNMTDFFDKIGHSYVLLAHPPSESDGKCVHINYIFIIN